MLTHVGWSNMSDTVYKEKVREGRQMKMIFKRHPTDSTFESDIILSS